MINLAQFDMNDIVRSATSIWSKPVDFRKRLQHLFLLIRLVGTITIAPFG